jgi:two-component system osmolarity sensor histidine kinase EnvZ
MLAGISHDLRTPLTRLRLETEMSPVDEQTRELMVADIEQMDAIIGQFLDYARPSGEMLEDVDLTELVRDTAPVYSAHDDIDLTLKLAPEAIARCNRMETQRILDNLIENARRYGKTPGTNRAEITVSTFLQGNEVVLCVADRGTGVPANQLALLTRPFYRLESARSEAKGAGLGMSIVNRILQRSGGRLVLENRTPPETGLLVSACYARA